MVLWDQICEDDQYEFGVIAAKTLLNRLAFLITDDFSVTVKCSRPTLSINKHDINYGLVINKNGVKCQEINEITESKRRRIGDAREAGPSEQRKLPMPQITQDLLANFGKNSPSIETLNLLDNFVGNDDQQKPAE
ncbi:hypothetical protein niasHT_029017 [Heterodera trifolii]|uniref:Uncharacterized protein n=1 Tax=Heterodera trifolii TaxID=157864 RepID=A0ABD2K8H1_9BILA